MSTVVKEGRAIGTNAGSLKESKPQDLFANQEPFQNERESLVTMEGQR